MQRSRPFVPLLPGVYAHAAVRPYRGYPLSHRRGPRRLSRQCLRAMAEGGAARQSGAAGDVSRPRPPAAARDGDVGGRVCRQVSHRRGAGPACDRRRVSARGGRRLRRRVGLVAGRQRLPGAVAVAVRPDQSRPELPPGSAAVGPGARRRHLGRLGPLPHHAGTAAVARGQRRHGRAALREPHGGPAVRPVPRDRLAAAGRHRLEQGEPGAGTLAGAALPGHR